MDGVVRLEKRAGREARPTGPLRLACVGLWCAAKGFRLRLRPFVGALLSFLFGDAVPLLQFSNELVTAPGDHLEVVVRQFAEALLEGTFCLHPFPFHLIPVHVLTLLSNVEKTNGVQHSAWLNAG